MVDFKLYDTFTISLRGSGAVYERLDSTFGPFRAETEQLPDIQIDSKSDSELSVVDSILGGPEEFYSIVDDEFVFVKYGDSIKISSDLSKITCSANAPPNFVRLLIEWRLRQKLLKDGFSMIHASGVKYDGETIVFPAWRHTGKTNTMLTFLQDGASYLSDDLLFVSPDGLVRGYPTDLHLLSYNYRSFPDLAPDSSISKLRSSLSKTINDITQSRSSKISKGINLVNEAVIAEDDWLPVDKVFPDTETIIEDELDRVVLLRTTTDDKPRIESLSRDELTAALSSINYREWDLDLLEISSAHKSLTGEDTFHSNVKEAIEVQKEIFQDISSNVSIDLLYVPREERWSEETKDRILSLVSDSR